MRTHLGRRMAALVALVAATLVAPVVESAGAADSTIHLERAPTNSEWDSGQVSCLVAVTDQRADGELVADWSCYLGADAAGYVAAESLITMSSTTIGTHFDGVFSGSFITVSGTTCGGGWLNLSAAWVNRISSTSSSCLVRHYDGYNLTGAVQSVFVAPLTTLDDRANSLQYT